MISCIIIDDEPLAIDVLVSHVDQVDALHLVGTGRHAVDAMNLLHGQTVDVMFLDIQMPKLTGLDFLKTLSSPPQVILTTAYRDYAVESYELDVVDYLLKPVSFDRFLMAINKLDQGIEDSKPSKPFLTVKADRKHIKVDPDEIRYIEGMKDYVRIHMRTGRPIVALRTIKDLAQCLLPHGFIRIHKSFIIPVQSVRAFSSNHVELFDQELPIGRNYRALVAQHLQEME